MKKLIIIGGAVIVFGALVGPKIVGDSAQQAYLQQFDRVPEHASVKFEQLSYDQAWFSSKAATKMRLAVGDVEIDAITSLINCRLNNALIIKFAFW